jgi:hypothetical protein
MADLPPILDSNRDTAEDTRTTLGEGVWDHRYHRDPAVCHLAAHPRFTWP